MALTGEAAVSQGFAKVGAWLDLLVSNAGIANSSNGPIKQLSLNGWRRMLESHVTCAFLMPRQAVPLLRPAKRRLS